MDTTATDTTKNTTTSTLSGGIASINASSTAAQSLDDGLFALNGTHRWDTSDFPDVCEIQPSGKVFSVGFLSLLKKTNNDRSDTHSFGYQIKASDGSGGRKAKSESRTLSRELLLPVCLLENETDKHLSMIDHKFVANSKGHAVILVGVRKTAKGRLQFLGLSGDGDITLDSQTCAGYLADKYHYYACHNFSPDFLSSLERKLVSYYNLQTIDVELEQAKTTIKELQQQIGIKDRTILTLKAENSKLQRDIRMSPSASSSGATIDKKTTAKEEEKLLKKAMNSNSKLTEELATAKTEAKMNKDAGKSYLSFPFPLFSLNSLQYILHSPPYISPNPFILLLILFLVVKMEKKVAQLEAKIEKLNEEAKARLINAVAAAASASTTTASSTARTSSKQSRSKPDEESPTKHSPPAKKGKGQDEDEQTNLLRLQLSNSGN